MNAPHPNPLEDALLARIEEREATVAIIGLGYVGLPLSAAFHRSGFRVIGFDIDPAKIKALSEGRSYFKHVPHELFTKLRDSPRFTPSGDYARLSGADAILICLPTPLTASREPDLGYITATAEALVPHLRRGQVVVLESTTYPGTTREVLKPILEQSGLASGQDFFLAYSPEREDPGNPDYGTADIPKVVGGDGPSALRLATALYAQVVSATVPVSSPEAAEAAKLTENIFRAVNIALVNELKVIYEAMGIDVWEVIDAAKTKPFGFMAFYPGPGLGGHCIPIDPFYLSWKARQIGQQARFIELAGQVNHAMPAYVIEQLSQALEAQATKELNGSRVLLVGMAYKKNVDDTRESPGLEIMHRLEAAGAQVAFHDPLVATIPPTRAFADLAGRQSVALSGDKLARYDAVMILTDHDDIDYGLIARKARLVVDTRNALAVGPRVVKA